MDRLRAARDRLRIAFATAVATIKSTRFAIAAAWVFLVVVALFSLRTSADVQELLDARLREARSADAQQVENCVQRAVQTPALQRLLNAISMELNDPLAREDARNFARVSAANTPTLSECRGLAKRLGVKSVDIPNLPPG